MVGRSVSHYRILRELGAGGMGIVYEAEDARLGRRVALKFLPDRLKNDHAALARFRQEACTASSLNHPHICTIHDIDDSHGQPFIAMELLEGEPLRTRVANGRLPLSTVTQLALELADALEAAHAKGIVHRDLKPENVFITARGTAKLLDFGIAKLGAEQAAATAAVTLTRVATGPIALGTVAYMSPEQVRGEPLDGRTDLFSLGVLLYELLTGTQPFRGTTSGAVVGEILTRAPTAPVRLNPDVPPDLERLVNKLLEKDRELRYQSARDVRVDLERLRRGRESVSAATSAPGQVSIVVLPFENLSSDPEQEYFCDGMTDEIITVLSKIAGLRVISRNSAMALKGSRRSARETGALLHVSHVLQGSVRKGGNSVRINATLVDAAADVQIWAERYSGTLDRVFEIQDDVAAAVAEALKVTIAPADRVGLRQRSVADERAQECFRRAWHEMADGTAASFHRALRLVTRGQEVLGDHPTLVVAVAQLHYLGVEWGLEPHDELLANAVRWTRRVESEAPDRASSLLAKLERFTGSLERSMRHFEDALRIDPADSMSMWYLSHTYSLHGGKAAAGRSVAARLVSIDPLNGFEWLDEWGACWADGDFEAAWDALRRVESTDSSRDWLSLFRPATLARLGRHEEALREAEADADSRSSHWVRAWSSGLAHALRGDRNGLAALVSGSLQERLWNDADSPPFIASSFALAGDRETAINWLERWVDRGAFNYPWLAHVDPLLENVRGEPRFKQLLERVRPVWEGFVPRFTSNEA